MTTTTDMRPKTEAGSLASSAAFRTFAVVFAVTSPVIYVICEMQNWPLFTYQPAANRFDWFYVPPVRDLGPAMYWYGWIANAAIASGVLGVLATMLPERIVNKIPLSLVWIVPLAAIPVLIYALRFFWRW
jgi:hypothetical membrane protein